MIAVTKDGARIQAERFTDENVENFYSLILGVKISQMKVLEYSRSYTSFTIERRGHFETFLAGDWAVKLSNNNIVAMTHDEFTSLFSIKEEKSPKDIYRNDFVAFVKEYYPMYYSFIRTTNSKLLDDKDLMESFQCAVHSSNELLCYCPRQKGKTTFLCLGLIWAHVCGVKQSSLIFGLTAINYSEMIRDLILPRTKLFKDFEIKEVVLINNSIRFNLGGVHSQILTCSSSSHCAHENVLRGGTPFDLVIGDDNRVKKSMTKGPLINFLSMSDYL